MWLLWSATWPLRITARHPALEMLPLWWCWFKSCCQSSCPRPPLPPQPAPPVPGWCLQVTHQCQVVHDTCLFLSPGMTTWAAQRIGLCPSLPEPGTSHVAGFSSSSCSATPVWGNHIWMCHLYPQVLPLTPSSSQSWELGVGSTSTAIKMGLAPNKWLFWKLRACPHCSAVQSFLLFALTVVSLAFSLSDV